MEEFLNQFFSKLHGGLLALVIVVSLGVLGKAADWLVDEAVSLSERSGIPRRSLAPRSSVWEPLLLKRPFPFSLPSREVRALRWATLSARSFVTPA